MDRAIAYIGKMDGAVSGGGGHDATFSVACVLVKGFALDEGVAVAVMRDHYNPRCSPAWSDKDLEHKVRSAAASAGEVGAMLRGGRSEGGGSEYFNQYKEVSEKRAAVGEAVRRKDMAVNEPERQRLLKQYGIAGLMDLMERSPVDVRDVRGADAFLSYLYEKDERVLVFTDFRSQGDFGHFSSGDGEVPGRSYRLGARQGVAASHGEIPKSSREGVWYLCNPVCGEWVRSGAKDKQGRPKVSRRCGKNVTAWRYMLLEADDVDAEEWVAVVSQLPLAVAAVYSSGGRSMHVLVRVDALSYEDFFRIAKKVEPVVAALGGDAAAISGVRLSRLPFCYREGSVDKDGKYVRYDKARLQRLVYLNPSPEVKALCSMRKVRSVELSAQVSGKSGEVSE